MKIRNELIDTMLNNEQYQDEPYVGCFWYDRNKKELFGVNKTLAIDVPFYHSQQFNTDVKTGRALHKTIWEKESHRKKDRRFSSNYTIVPRGRVFQFADGTFKICVGNWISSCPEAIDEIVDEFQLPDTAKVVIDSHWDIGHGWSNEF